MNKHPFPRNAKCVGCHKELTYTLPYDHKCHYCELILCRPCDDRGNTLRWEEVDGDDKYMCEPCQKKYADKYKK